MRLQLQITEHARSQLERGQLRWSCLVAQIAKTHIERVSHEPAHCDIRVRTRIWGTVGGTHRGKLVKASLLIVDHHRAHSYTGPAEPLIHKRADARADSGNHGQWLSARDAGTEALFARPSLCKGAHWPEGRTRGQDYEVPDFGAGLSAAGGLLNDFVKGIEDAVKKK